MVTAAMATTRGPASRHVKAADRLSFHRRIHSQPLQSVEYFFGDSFDAKE